MRRGTTPTHTFQTDIDLTAAAVIYLTYKVGGKVAFEKTGEDLTVTAESISTTLTQEETLSLKGQNAEIQIRARFEDGSAVASNIMRTGIEQILKDGVI